MRYFFDVLERDECLRDEDGTSFSSFDHMRVAARRTLAQMALDEPLNGDTVSLALRVRDEHGAVVYNICLDVKGQSRPH